MKRSGAVLFDVAYLTLFWAVAILREFDTFFVVLAALWTVRVVVCERHGYRLVTRGRTWAPSKSPDDYR